MSTPDWDAIRAEYIAGSMSQRDLADAHGVRERELRERAAREKWYDLRREAGEKAAKGMVDAISKQKVTKAKKILDQLLTQAQIASRQLTKQPKTITTHEKLPDGTIRVTVKKVYEETKGVDRAGLRLLSQTLKDLTEVEARLNGQNEKSDNTIRVEFVTPEEEDYSS